MSGACEVPHVSHEIELLVPMSLTSPMVFAAVMSSPSCTLGKSSGPWSLLRGTSPPRNFLQVILDGAGCHEHPDHRSLTRGERRTLFVTVLSRHCPPQIARSPPARPATCASRGVVDGGPLAL